MPESLRTRVVEAGARAWCEANGHFFDLCAWEEQHLVNAGLAFDAMLDCLTEYADEWQERAIADWQITPDVGNRGWWHPDFMLVVLREDR